MMDPLFVQGQRARLAAITAALRGHRRVLVRVYESVNVATTTAAKYNARYGDSGIDFYVRRSDGGIGEPMWGLYGVYAYKIGGEGDS